MPRRPVFTVICLTAGFVFAALGALVLMAQCMEWLSFGNWNPVSIRYALNYFAIHTPHFGAASTGIRKFFNWLEDALLGLPLSLVLIGIGGLIAAIGVKPALIQK